MNPHTSLVIILFLAETQKPNLYSYLKSSKNIIVELLNALKHLKDCREREKLFNTCINTPASLYLYCAGSYTFI